jgi:hypothetical protein
MYENDPLLIQPKNTMPRINEVWAFLSIDPKDSNEGVMATRMGSYWVPLIGTDEARIKSLRPMVEEMAQRFDLKVKLVKFTHREELEKING